MSSNAAISMGLSISGLLSFDVYLFLTISLFDVIIYILPALPLSTWGLLRHYMFLAYSGIV